MSMKRKKHKHVALNLMIDRYSDPVTSILMADHGYESFNTFAHLIQKNMRFVIRMKDINSNWSLSTYELPDDEFHTHIKTTFTRQYPKETVGNPNIYTIIQLSTGFDSFDEKCRNYNISFSIVRIQLKNEGYICISTNLSEKEFSLKEIKTLHNAPERGNQFQEA